jgi:gamma-glutamyltranspeptidase/glutathione hydrolase
MRVLLALTLALLAACGGTKGPTAAPAAPEPVAGGAPPPAVETTARSPLIGPKWPLTDRGGAVSGQHAMVVSAHPLASAVGADILRRGGNAVDAAVAVGFALAVVQPIAGNIGGGGFMVIRLHDGSVHALDYREVAPGGATAGMYVDSAGNVTEAALTGPLSAGVPGSVAGMFEAHHKYGKLPWADVVAPAVALARDGHVLDGIRSRNINLELARLTRFPASRAQFLLNGAAPPPGTPFVQRELGATLQLIADSGPKAFYYGSIADLIVQEMQRGGGLITKQDLAGYRPMWRVPIRITYRGYSIYTMPPSGGGVTLAEILNVMEGYPSLPRFGSAALMHLQAETMRRAFVDRNLYLGDPDVVPLPVERLLSKEYAATLRADIDVQHATPTQRMTPASKARRRPTTPWSMPTTTPWHAPPP